MTVYVLLWQEWDSASVRGVFSTREKAEAYKKADPERDLIVILPRTVDEPPKD